MALLSHGIKGKGRFPSVAATDPSTSSQCTVRSSLSRLSQYSISYKKSICSKLCCSPYCCPKFEQLLDCTRVSTVLLSRVESLLFDERRQQQLGFNPVVQHPTHVIALRLLSDLHREFSGLLYVAYVDLKSAFDSVDRVQTYGKRRSMENEAPALFESYWKPMENLWKTNRVFWGSRDMRWQDMISNTTIAEKPGLPSVSAVVDARRAALFGHVVIFDDRVPTRCTLRLAMDVRSGTRPSPSGKRPPGRLHDTWLKPFLRSHIPIRERWDAAIRCGSAQRSSLDTRHWLSEWVSEWDTAWPHQGPPPGYSLSSSSWQPTITTVPRFSLLYCAIFGKICQVI